MPALVRGGVEVPASIECESFFSDSSTVEVFVFAASMADWLGMYRVSGMKSRTQTQSTPARMRVR